MTEEQYENAESDLMDRLVAMRESDGGGRVIVLDETSGVPMDSMDDVYDVDVSSERQAAWREYQDYCRVCKNSTKYPKKLKKMGLMCIGGIQLGIVEQRGDDLTAHHPFVKCNLADFIDDTGYFNLVKFLGHNKRVYPYLYKLVCCLSSLRTSEVGCERFFSTAGYVSNPRRTRLKVKNYERIAMLKRNLSHIYIDEDWVVERYMHLEKTKEWDNNDTKEDNLVVALEEEIHNEEMGLGYSSANENIQIVEAPQDEVQAQQIESTTTQPKGTQSQEAIGVEDSSDDTDSDSSDSGHTDSSAST